MSGSISFNPYIQTTFSGSFNASTNGLVAGTAYPDPASRFYLTGGHLASTETLPMWGGVGISEAIPVPGVTDTLLSATPAACGDLGTIVTRATTLASGAGGLTGFSVFDQAHSWITTPQSQVPTAGVGGLVNLFRLGSNIRIAVAIDPVLVSLENGSISGPVSWDFAQQRLVPYVAAYPANVITAATWASTSGGTATLTTTTAHGVSVGDDITITGITPSAYNGTFTTISGTTGSTLKYLLPAASTPGAGTAFGTLVAGGGALNVQILELQVGNSMVPVYDPVKNVVNWNRNGSAAIIKL